MTVPVVSVVIPAYNAGRYIDETLERVFKQTQSRLEVIVVDDGSTDDTRARLEVYGSRIRYVRQANAGVGAARNRGFEVATGEYVALLDADDLWSPEKLEVQLEVATRHLDSGLIACDGVRVADGQIVSQGLLSGWVVDQLRASSSGEITGRFDREFLRGNPIACPSQMLIPRHVVARVGRMVTGRDEAEDWDYSLRIALEFPITFHQHSLVGYRVHSGSRSGPAAERQFVWTFWDLRLLRRRLQLCPPADRALLRQVFRATVRNSVYDAYYYARRGDPRSARRFLLKLLRWAPREPRVSLVLIATLLPDPVIGWLAAVGRRALAVLGRGRGGAGRAG